MTNAVCEGDNQALTEIINKALASLTEDYQPLLAPETKEHFVPSQYIITEEQTEKSLSSIKVNKRAGPDKIPNFVWRDSALFLAQPVCALWNASLHCSYLPNIWKSADITPVPKVKAPTRPDKDIRPISLTPVISKCLEWYPREWIMDMLQDDLDPMQFGSRKGLSTTLALAELVHTWLLALKIPGTTVRALLLDFRKAFNKVDHFAGDNYFPS